MTAPPKGIVKGIVLAAGAGSRLHPLTESLPKTLLTVDGDDTLLDLALANLSVCGIREVVVVTGFAADEIERRLPDLRARYDLDVTTLYNPEALTRNNAYSLWLAREEFAGGAVLVNGDTLHPASVVTALLERAGEGGFDVALAVDEVKRLGEEEMKVVLDGDGRLARINKALDPAAAWGEYIGVSLLAAAGAARLAESLEATWKRDAGLYYEDGYQELADRGGAVVAVPVGGIEWVEVDDHADLERARAIRCGA